MAIFGSFIGKDRSLFGEAVNVAVLDTFVAFVAGLIIFPACFTYNNGNVSAGPPLIFETLPNIFNNMPLGRLWGSLFFLFLSFAALSTVFAVFENILACVQEITKMSRKKLCIILAVAMFVLTIPCVLGFNAWSGFTPFGNGSSVLDLEDFIVSNLLLPIGSFTFVMFCILKKGKGWGYENFENILSNLGADIKRIN
jgi:NSS family neurotransmitter:Na+ symporter